MKNKILIILITVFIWMAALPLAQNAAAKEKILPYHEVIKAEDSDKRTQILQAYLAQYDSPLQNHAQDFIEAADKYDLDWKLVASISGVESTFGKFIPGGYNAWGWGVYGDQALGFKSWRDGIFTVSEGLRKNYVNRGLNNPYKMNRVYAASPTWGSKVTYFMADLEEFTANYQAERKIVVSPFLDLKAPVTLTLLASR